VTFYDPNNYFLQPTKELIAFYFVVVKLFIEIEFFVRFRHKKGRGERGSLLSCPKPGREGFTQMGEGQKDK